MKKAVRIKDPLTRAFEIVERLRGWTAFVIAVGFFLGLYLLLSQVYVRQCRRLLAVARTSQDSILVYTTRPAREAFTCGEYLR